jgi:HSP20 family protein
MSLFLNKRNGNLFPALFNDLFADDNFLRSSFPDLRGGLKGRDVLSVRVPSVNITEHDQDFRIELAVPGLNKEDFKIETRNNILVIRSEKEEENKDEKESYFRKEFSYNSFNRSFQLPENAEPDKIDARYENGILKVTIPKKQSRTSKLKKEIKVL